MIAGGGLTQSAWEGGTRGVQKTVEKNCQDARCGDCPAEVLPRITRRSIQFTPEGRPAYEIFMTTLLYLIGALVLIVLNGFFVAAEFALVKVRPSLLCRTGQRLV